MPLANFETTVTSGGATSLTVANAENQFFTGTGGTVVLPVVSTLPATGWEYFLVNISSGIITVNSSGGNFLANLNPGATARFTCILLTGTDETSWENSYKSQSFGSLFVGTLLPLQPTNALYLDFSSGSNTLGFVKGDLSGLIVLNISDVIGSLAWVAPNVDGTIVLNDGLAPLGDNVVPKFSGGVLVDSGLSTGLAGEGLDGNQGSRGFQGFQGTSGAQGNQGNQGSQGNQGNQGNQGAAGIDGIDANTAFFLTRDTNGNSSLNNLLEGYATTVTSNGNTTLTVASGKVQRFTGTSGQTITLPVVSTLALNHSFLVVNDSTVGLIINSSGGNAILNPLPAGRSVLLTCVKITGTDATSWTYSIFGTTTNYQVQSTVLDTISPLSGTGFMAYDDSFFVQAALRIITGTANQISVINGDGSAGNPTISLANPLTIPGKLIASNTIRLKGYTVSTLPAGTQGDTAFVTDALTPSFGVVLVGGGSVVAKAFYNGTSWVDA